MALEWSWTLLVAYGFLAAELGGLVFLTAPKSWAARTLAVLLLVEGISYGGILAGFLVVSDNRVLYDIYHLTALTLPMLYFVFIGQAVDNRWSRPFAAVKGQVALLVLTAALIVAYLVHTRLLGASGEIWFFIDNLFIGAAAFIGLLAALRWVLATAPGTVDRVRSLAYLTAFAARDIAILVFGFGFGIVNLILGNPVGDARMTGPVSPVVALVWALLFFVFVVALVYGVLRGHILDLHVKIKWTVKQGTIATIGITVFFAISEGASAFFADRSGSTYLGIGIASIVVLTLAPIMRFAERSAATERAAAADGGTPFAIDERRQLYRDQVEIAWSDRTLAGKERAFLANLRQRLGLSPQEAGAIELEIMEAASQEDGSKEEEPVVVGDDRHDEGPMTDTV